MNIPNTSVGIMANNEDTIIDYYNYIEMFNSGNDKAMLNRYGTDDMVDFKEQEDKS